VLSGRQLIKGFGETILVRLHPNFNCVLTCEMTLKCWVGRKHSTVKAKWVVTTFCVTDIAITFMYYSTNQKKAPPLWTLHHIHRLNNQLINTNNNFILCTIAQLHSKVACLAQRARHATSLVKQQNWKPAVDVARYKHFTMYNNRCQLLKQIYLHWIPALYVKVAPTS
jgi:hypothetical protein